MERGKTRARFWLYFRLDKKVTRVFFTRFLFECRKVIGFALNKLYDWLKNSRHFFIQSKVKPKPIVTRFHSGA